MSDEWALAYHPKPYPNDHTSALNIYVNSEEYEALERSGYDMRFIHRFVHIDTHVYGDHLGERCHAAWLKKKRGEHKYMMFTHLYGGTIR